MSSQAQVFDSRTCGEPGCGRKALIWTHGKKANRKIHTDPKHGLCFRHWRAQKARGFAQVFAMVALLVLLVAGRAAAQTTTVIGNFRDATGAIVPSGQVTFELQPGIDTTISGNARFGPQTTTCTINASTAFGSSGVVRATNVVTVTFTAPHPFVLGDTITVSSMADTSYNGTFTVATVPDSLHITWAQTGANSGTGGGVISALRNSQIVASCTVVQNTALQPQGTSYKVSVWPGFAQTSSFVWYAIGAGPVDLSTVVPTPAGLPAYAIVDTFSNQTINGNKTFNGTVTILGALNLPGAASFTGSAFISSSSNPAATGIFRVASGDLALCWRNNANTGDLCFTKTAGDVLQFNGSSVGTGGTVTSVAQTVPSWLTVTGSPVTTSGTLAITATGGQTANSFVATPCGSAGGVALRVLCASDIAGLSWTHPTIATGIVNNGSGFQHKRSGSCSGGSCAFTWPSSFADANYTVVCEPIDSVATAYVAVWNKTASGMTVEGFNGAGAVNVGEIDCIGVHD